MNPQKPNSSAWPVTNGSTANGSTANGSTASTEQNAVAAGTPDPSASNALVPYDPALTALAPLPTTPRTKGSGRIFNPFLSIERHKRLAALIFLVSVLLSVPIAWRLGGKVYYTESVVFVSPRFLKNLQDDTEKELQSNAQYREFVQQQMRTVGRYDIVLAALQRNPEILKFWRKPNETEQHAVERLQAALILRPVPETYQFTVGLEASQPDYLAEMVNLVTDTFLEKDKKDEVYGKDRRIEDLQGEQARLLTEVKQKMEERSKIAQSLGVTTFTGDLINPFDHLLINRKNDLAETQRARIEKEAELAVANDQSNATKSTLLEQARELVARDQGLNSLKDRFNERRRDLYTKLSGLGPQHPGRQDAEREIAEMDTAIKDSNEQLLGLYSNMLLTQRQAQVKLTQRAEVGIQELLADHSEKARDFSRQYQNALLLGVEINNINRRLGAVSDRINYLTLESQAPGFMRLFSAARVPEMPVKGGHKKYVLLLAALGLLLGLITPIVLDYLDPRIHTLAEAEAFLGFAPFGGLLRYRTADQKKVVQDQIMRLACAIERERRLNGSRIFLLTSAERGSGTSTLALGIRQALNRLGLSAAAVKSNSAFQDDRYLKAAPSNLSSMNGAHQDNPVAATGSKPNSLEPALNQPTTHLPASLFNQSNDTALPLVNNFSDAVSLGNKIQTLAEQYDIVLLDAPPAHLASDTEVLAAYADTAILIVQASATSRDHVAWILRQMERWHVPALGVALNQIEPSRETKLAAALPDTSTTIHRFTDRLWRQIF